MASAHGLPATSTADPAPVPAGDETLPPPPFAHTAVQCLVMVARHHGLDLSLARLRHDYVLENREPTLDFLVRMAQDNGLRAEAARLDWAGLANLGEAYPALARLKNGNMVVVCGSVQNNDQTVMVVRDPMAMERGFIGFDEASWLQMWSGEVVLLKRQFTVRDAEQKFGLTWFLPEILRQKRLYIDIGFSALVLSLIGLAIPLFTQFVIDTVLVHHSYNMLVVLSIGIALAIAFEGAFGCLRRFLLLAATNRVDSRINTKTFAQLVSLPMDFFEHNSAGMLIKHVTQAEHIREFLTGRMFSTLLDMLSILIFVPVLLTYSAELTGYVLGCTGLIALIIVCLIPPYKSRLAKLYEADGRQQSFLVETIQGMRTVKSLALDTRHKKEWDARVANAVHMKFQVGQITTAANALVGILDKGMQAGIIGLGTSLVFNNDLTIGGLIAFQVLSGRVAAPLVSIVGLVHSYQETLLSVRKLGEVMNAKPERSETSRGIMPPIRGVVEFQDVRFRYHPSLPPALDHVSFRAEEGTILGIMGRSGSGKTTVTRLLQGLHSPEDGTIRLDGYDLREIDLIYLRSSIGVVLQDSFLFRGTVRDNLAAAKPDATMEEIQEAARLAGAAEFIEKLPNKYDTWLEEGSSNLSGGQRQRMAIARALITKPRLLILDEATSALDAESEAIVQTNLLDIARGRTVIIVSHRLSNLVPADQILVLDRGRLVDAGRHGELLGRCSIYQLLWQQQTRHVA